jgi:protein-tyrosine phosphatase
VIDLHCHYLPEVDDGAASLREALGLLRLAMKDGATKLVLTPHLFVGRWDNVASMLRPRFEAFCALAKAKDIEIEMFLGAEVRLQPDLVRLVDRGEISYIGGWDGFKVMLLELEDGRIPVGAINGVRYLKREGILPMLAHPERNKAVMADPEVLEPFVAEGCLLQLTAASIIGGFGKRAEAAAHRLLELGWVTAVASDAHNLLHRPPLMTPARDLLAEYYGKALARALTQDAPARLIAGRSELRLS